MLIKLLGEAFSLKSWSSLRLIMKLRKCSIAWALVMRRLLLVLMIAFYIGVSHLKNIVAMSAVFQDSCHVCGFSRWKTVKGKEGQISEGHANAKIGEPAKVMRYFLLIPRLRRIYMSPKSAEHMKWHDRDHVKDGKLRHPADAIAWREFHALYADFAFDPRDGFNPYRLMNTTYSIWPIVLIPYNLPLWLCMKSM